jgi:hypothetical protein
MREPDDILAIDDDAASLDWLRNRWAVSAAVLVVADNMAQIPFGLHSLAQGERRIAFLRTSDARSVPSAAPMLKNSSNLQKNI